MESLILETIKSYAMKTLQIESGYCSEMSMPTKSILHSELKTGEDVKITIEIVKSE